MPTLRKAIWAPTQDTEQKTGYNSVWEPYEFPSSIISRTIHIRFDNDVTLRLNPLKQNATTLRHGDG